MTWLAPWYLAAGALAALAVVALHLLAWRRPPAAMLPTARFIPDAPARARARSARPADPLLLALRVLALLLVAAALARPVRVATRRPLARIIVADLSASVADAAAVRAQVTALARAADAIVIADGERARVMAAGDSLRAVAGARPGRLSPALVAAGDAARVLAERADSAELLLVSPLAREEVDAATIALAHAWKGRVAVASVAVAPQRAVVLAPLHVEATGDDAVAAGATASGTRADAGVRVVRRALSAADSAWVAGAIGRVLVSWPATLAASAAPTAALAWNDDAFIAPVAPDGAPQPGRAIVRWADGAAAATEREVGGSCVRDVRVAIPRAGDVTLSTGFARLLVQLAQPCGGARDTTRVTLAQLGVERAGPARPLPRPAPRDPWELARWLLGVALALLLVEPLLRRGDGSMAASADAARRPRAEAA